MLYTKGIINNIGRRWTMLDIKKADSLSAKYNMASDEGVQFDAVLVRQQYFQSF